jgi:phosphoribosyl-ATP pyrophosphohydrolase
LRDLEKQLALLQQRVEKSGTTQYLRKDVQKILQKIEAEYENHLVKDTHGQLHEAFEKEVSNDWEPFAE